MIWVAVDTWVNHLQRSKHSIPKFCVSQAVDEALWALRLPDSEGGLSLPSYGRIGTVVGNDVQWLVKLCQRRFEALQHFGSIGTIAFEDDMCNLGFMKLAGGKAE